MPHSSPGIRVCVVAGMIDAKLHSKLAPIQNIEQVAAIYLVRRQRYLGKKVTCYSPPRRLGGLRTFAEPWRLLTLVYLCLVKKPDFLIAFGTVPHGIYAWVLGKLFRIPVIQHVMGKNDLRLTFPGQWGRAIALAAVRNGYRIAVRGDSMRQWLIEHGVPSGKIFVPQNVHDFDLFSQDSTVGKKYDLVYVGFLERYKRIDLLLESLAMVQARRPGTTLLLIGDGSLRNALEIKAKNLGMTDLVHFCGKQEFASLPSLLNQARVFIMTSQGEGLPMAMIEAMSCGLPVIVPSDADIEEVAMDEMNALVVASHEPGAFAEKIVALLGNEQLCKRLSEGALLIRREKAEEYSLGHQAKVWEEAIDPAECDPNPTA